MRLVIALDHGVRANVGMLDLVDDSTLDAGMPVICVPQADAVSDVERRLRGGLEDEGAGGVRSVKQGCVKLLRRAGQDAGGVRRGFIIASRDTAGQAGRADAGSRGPVGRGYGFGRFREWRRGICCGSGGSYRIRRRRSCWRIIPSGGELVWAIVR